MIKLRDITKSDEIIYKAWQNDSELSVYLSRLYPHKSYVGDYNKKMICWFIIKYDAYDIGSVWLEKDLSEEDTMVLGIFIAEEEFRGKGIGSKAVEKAIQISKNRIPFRKIKLNVQKNNLRAIQCYKKI